MSGLLVPSVFLLGYILSLYIQPICGPKTHHQLEAGCEVHHRQGTATACPTWHTILAPFVISSLSRTNVRCWHLWWIEYEMPCIAPTFEHLVPSWSPRFQNVDEAQPCWRKYSIQDGLWEVKPLSLCQLSPSAACLWLRRWHFSFLFPEPCLPPVAPASFPHLILIPVEP